MAVHLHVCTCRSTEMVVMMMLVDAVGTFCILLSRYVNISQMEGPAPPERRAKRTRRKLRPRCKVFVCIYMMTKDEITGIQVVSKYRQVCQPTTATTKNNNEKQDAFHNSYLNANPVLLAVSKATTAMPGTTNHNPHFKCPSNWRELKSRGVHRLHSHTP